MATADTHAKSRAVIHLCVIALCRFPVHTAVARKNQGRDRGRLQSQSNGFFRHWVGYRRTAGSCLKRCFQGVQPGAADVVSFLHWGIKEERNGW